MPSCQAKGTIPFPNTELSAQRQGRARPAAGIYSLTLHRLFRGKEKSAVWEDWVFDWVLVFLILFCYCFGGGGGWVFFFPKGMVVFGFGFFLMGRGLSF